MKKNLIGRRQAKKPHIGLTVKEELKNMGITTTEAARRLGVSPAGVSVYFSGRPFSARAAKKWATEFDLNEEYLVSGTGLPSKHVRMVLTPAEKNLILKMRLKKNSKAEIEDISGPDL